MREGEGAVQRRWSKGKNSVCRVRGEGEGDRFARVLIRWVIERVIQGGYADRVERKRWGIRLKHQRGGGGCWQRDGF